MKQLNIRENLPRAISTAEVIRNGSIVFSKVAIFVQESIGHKFEGVLLADMKTHRAYGIISLLFESALPMADRMRSPLLNFMSLIVVSSVIV